MKIIIAEDNPVILKLYKNALGKAGYNIILTTNGIEALDSLNKTGARMIITDWEMPGMDGLSLCRHIRKQKNKKYVYIIFVSSHNDETDAITGLNAGADDYIKKPFHPDELKSRIKAGKRIIELEDKFRQAYGNLLQAEKMASMGSLAAGIAHEINNPVSFISGNLDLMAEYQTDLQNIIKKYRNMISALENKNKDLSNDIKSMIENIKTIEKDIDLDFLITDSLELLHENQKGIARVNDLVQELRTFAHPGEPEMKTVNLNKEIQAVLNIVQRDIKFRKKILVNLGDIPELFCNPAELNQVFFCLLSNAALATAEKGRVKISTRTDKDNIIVMVSDTGTGIKKELMPKIFDPFFTTRDVGKGKGMGLNAAYNIVKNHSGTIDVKSDTGRGSVFSIILPVKRG